MWEAPHRPFMRNRAMKRERVSVLANNVYEEASALIAAGYSRANAERYLAKHYMLSLKDAQEVFAELTARATGRRGDSLQN